MEGQYILRCSFPAEKDERPLVLYYGPFPDWFAARKEENWHRWNEIPLGRLAEHEFIPVVPPSVIPPQMVIEKEN